LPGQELFQYLDEGDNPQTIDSSDVNAYLREVTGEEFTAKDFRTWAGTLLAAMALQEFKVFDSETEAKRNIVRAIETVAKRLGNTPAVCRKSYVHPAILELYTSGALMNTLEQAVEKELREELAQLQPEEAAVLAILQQRLKRDTEHNGA
jgi:DNA topoisomerase-1